MGTNTHTYKNPIKTSLCQRVFCYLYLPTAVKRSKLSKGHLFNVVSRHQSPLKPLEKQV